MSYANIGPTAWHVASQRTLGDIKYAKEIFGEIGDYVKSASAEEIAYLKEAGTHNLAPMFEARYLLTNRIIDRSGVKQILEIAAGLSPRGLAYTDDPSFTFVETDLRAMVEEKRRIAKKIVGERANLYIEEADALSADSLARAALHFASGPIAIVTEGLLRYLSFEEKAIVAKNIHTLLEKFGGFWVTPDVAVAKRAHPGNVPGHQAGVMKLSGIDLGKNRFENTESGKKFFEDLGFTVERFSFGEVIEALRSPAALNMPMADVRELFEGRETFVMKAV